MWREGREGTVKEEEHCWAKVEEIPTRKIYTRERSQTGDRLMKDGQNIWGFTGWFCLEVPEAGCT